MTKRDVDRQCPSCGGFCKKSGCERANVCTSDEWLANATQSTRDLANKIKRQQFKGTGNQLRNETEEEVRAREIEELKERNHDIESQMQALSNDINDYQNTIDKQRRVLEQALEALTAEGRKSVAQYRNWDDDGKHDGHDDAYVLRIANGQVNAAITAIQEVLS